MFFDRNDKVLDKDILIEQLIRETNETTSYMWCRKNYETYYDYKYVVKINETIDLVFHIYHYKIHDNHRMNMYLSRKKNTAFTDILSINDESLLLLIKAIEKGEKFYKEPIE
jgi:hypothetical protein